MDASVPCMLLTSEAVHPAGKRCDTEEREDAESAGDVTPPSTTASECSEPAGDEEWESEALEQGAAEEVPCVETRASGATQHESERASDEEEVPQLGPGLFDDAADAADAVEAPAAPAPVAPPAAPPAEERTADGAREGAGFTREETLFVFDWDDTILPSTWIKRQGLRLDSTSRVSLWQRERLVEAAAAAAETLRAAKQRGTVVLVTNAERGWIELSCQKFTPSLLPLIENIKIVSARTSYETAQCTAPLQWKVLAFEAEIDRACGPSALADPARRKNIHSLGDSVHEREALLRATVGAPNCCWKSLKFVDRPDISQLITQHATVVNSFDQVVQHDGNMDLTINCS